MSTTLPPPPPPYHHAAPPPPMRRSKGSPWVSCAIGCAVVAGILIVVAVALFVWLLLPTRAPVDLTRLVGTDAAMMIHLPDASGDAGVSALLTKLQQLQRRMQLEALREEAPEQGDRVVEWLLRMQEVNRIQAGQLPQIMMVLEPGPDSEARPGLILGVSLNTVPKLITLPLRLLIQAGMDEGAKVRYRGATYMNQDVQIMATKGLFLLTSEAGLMEGVIDRMMDGPAAATLLEAAPADAAGRWDLYVLGDNTEGALTAWIDELAASGEDLAALQALSWEQAAGLQWGMDVVDADQVRGELRIRCRDGDGAETWARDFREMADVYGDAIPVEGVDLHLDVLREGADVVVRMDLVGLDALLDAAFRELMRSESAEGAPAAEGQPE